MGKICPAAGEKTPNNRALAPKQVKWQSRHQKNTGERIGEIIQSP